MKNSSWENRLALRLSQQREAAPSWVAAVVIAKSSEVVSATALQSALVLERETIDAMK